MSRGLTQTELAAISQTTRDVVSRAECDAGGILLATAQSLSRALGVPIDELFPTEKGRTPIRRTGTGRRSAKTTEIEATR
ncbi:MAG: helix-turn-helix transcriptional regulator [Actinomycetota bacterium]|nr:helix-turn-helix transcriptional regulator [Actinomycetota bacterium]